MPIRVRRPALRRIHAEGYPRLDIREAHQQVTAGRPNILWRDQAGTVWGKGRASIDVGQLTVRSSFRDKLDQPAGGGEHVFVLETVMNDAGAKHYFTSCPACQKRTRVLAWLRGSWSCLTCQRLAHRSMLIGSVARRTEKLARLQREIGDGRPRGMHETTYQRRLADLRLLKAELQEETSTAAAEYGEMVTAIWLEEPPTSFEALSDGEDGGVAG